LSRCVAVILIIEETTREPQQLACLKAIGHPSALSELETLAVTFRFLIINGKSRARMYPDDVQQDFHPENTKDTLSHRKWKSSSHSPQSTNLASYCYHFRRSQAFAYPYKNSQQC